NARQASKVFLLQELYQPLANKALQIPGVIRIAGIDQCAELGLQMGTLRPARSFTLQLHRALSFSIYDARAKAQVAKVCAGRMAGGLTQHLWPVRAQKCEQSLIAQYCRSHGDTLLTEKHA